MTIQPVVVVYNNECSDSISVKAVLGQGLSPIIVDNSTLNNNNKEYCDERNIIYFSMNGNKGLSKAYNKALKMIPENTDYVLWLDDDTDLPDDFFLLLEKYVNINDKYMVYIPVVKAANNKKGLLSPCIMRHGYTYRVNAIDEINNKFSAINSGMLVSSKLYRDYAYDENIFLDCLDHDFMLYCWNNNISIKILKDIVIFQNFSGDEKGSKKGKLARYRIYSKDFRYFRQKYGYSRWSTELLLIKRLFSILI